jgi:hypothetical protein
MIDDKISLQTIYTECNNHLREIDKNRDQFIAFYLGLVSALLVLINTKSFSCTELIIPASFIVTLLGVILLPCVTEFRLWHFRYFHTAHLFVKLSKGKKDEFIQIEKNARDRTYKDLCINPYKPIICFLKPICSKDLMKWIFHRYNKGTQFYIYQAALLIAALPCYLLVENILPISNLLYPYVLGTTLLVIYLLMGNCFSARYLYKDLAKCPWAKQLLCGIENYDEEFTYDIF